LCRPRLRRRKSNLSLPNPTEPVMILMADDDEDDRQLTQDAMAEARLANELRFVGDGEELMEYLHHRGDYADGGREAPEPGIILLDLNMPRKDGREALAEIKSDPNLRHIPVVVLTTSRDEEDVVKTYDLGVNSFISKPVTFAGLVEVVQSFSRYWFEIVDLPLQGRPDALGA
jgi:two-component system, response regulator